jgi:DNA helicase-2/ATP-dependent DNA helicase PcrA
LLHKITRIEDFLWPADGRDWLEQTGFAEQLPDVYAQFIKFRDLVKRWTEAVLLPIDQIVLMLAQDLLTDPGELAVAYKLSVLLGRAQDAHPDWRLVQLSDELTMIAKNERRFIGFSESDSGFEPDKHRGKVIISTMHKAKGMEWDRVYLMSVNNYDFPSGESGDPYISEKWFIRDFINIEAEALAQLNTLVAGDEYTWYREGEATRAARNDYARERLRLLYVGITRAKKELIITWNNGQRGEARPATPLAALKAFQESQGENQYEPA